MIPQMWVQPRPHGEYGLIIPGTAEYDMARAAAQQVDKARARSPLASYQSAEGVKHFWRTPTSISDALFYAAFWTAVAARLLKSPGLASDASAYQIRAIGRAALPGSTTLLQGSAEEIQQVLTEAASKIRSRAGSTPSTDIRAVLAILGAKDVAAVSTAQDYQVTTGKAAVDIAANVGEDISAGAAYLRALIPGLEPKGPQPPRWTVWLGRVAIAAVVVGGAAWVLRPYAEATRDATRALGEKRRSRSREDAVEADDDEV